MKHGVFTDFAAGFSQVKGTLRRRIAYIYIFGPPGKYIL